MLIREILPVHTAGYESGAIIRHIIIQVAVSSAEFELFEEQRVVMEGQGIKYIEVGLFIELLLVSI